MTSSQLGERAGPAGLAEVADQRHRPRRAAAGEHAPLHRGEVLRLVDEHVAERARLAVVVAGAGRRVAAVAGEHVGRVGEPTDAELLDRASRLLELRVPACPAARPRAGPRSAARAGESASSTSGRSASVHATSATSAPRARNSSRCSASVSTPPDAERMSAVEPEQVVHELGAAQDRPHALERRRGPRAARRSRAASSSSHSAGRGLTRARARRRRSDRRRVAADRSAAARASRRRRGGRGRRGTRARARAGTRAGSGRAPARRRTDAARCACRGARARARRCGVESRRRRRST